VVLNAFPAGTRRRVNWKFFQKLLTCLRIVLACIETVTGGKIKDRKIKDGSSNVIMSIWK
jgi:hypothetical protein